MKTFAILSRKGGAGKSTIAAHLAVIAPTPEPTPIRSAGGELKTTAASMRADTLKLLSRVGNTLKKQRPAPFYNGRKTSSDQRLNAPKTTQPKAQTMTGG